MRISDWSSDVCSSDLSGDLERLRAALEEQWGLADLEADLRILQSLQKTLRAGNWEVTVAVHRGQVITAIWPGFHDRSFGIAFDIGTTTIAGHLSNLSSGEVIASSGLMNPQRSEEHTSELQSLMRISYAVFCLKKKTNKNNR